MARSKLPASATTPRLTRPRISATEGTLFHSIHATSFSSIVVSNAGPWRRSADTICTRGPRPGWL